MSSQNPNHRPSLYPKIIQSNPNPPPSSSNLYPSLDMRDLVENLFPENPAAPTAPPESTEQLLIRIPGAILHLIDKSYSVELACGDLSILRLVQDQNVVAVLARVNDEIQWPLTKDEAAVKIDDSHYFFSLNLSNESGSGSSSDDESVTNAKKCLDSENILNYGLSFAAKGQENLLKELDGILQHYSCFSVQKVSEKTKEKGEELLDGKVEKEMSPADLKSGKKKEMMEERCAAYWTTLAPNVEDYSGTAAKLIAAGSGQLIKGILWCGDVTVDRLKWGNDVMKKRVSKGGKTEISPDTLKRIKRYGKDNWVGLFWRLVLFGKFQFDLLLVS